jgi:hypothetical protein
MRYYSIKLRREWVTPPENGRSYKYDANTEYRVPKEISQKNAERALKTGLAVKVMPQRETKRAAKAR